MFLKNVIKSLLKFYCMVGCSLVACENFVFVCFSSRRGDCAFDPKRELIQT